MVQERLLVPKGRKDSAWGFNPGVIGLKRLRPNGAAGGPDVEQALDHTVCRPYSIPNPAVAGCNSDLAQYSNTPSHTFRARAQLVRRSHRSMMHAAQGRPRKARRAPRVARLAKEEARRAPQQGRGRRRKHEHDFDAPGEPLQPATRVQFGHGAILRYCSTPTL
jgi:hypothetical protein